MARSGLEERLEQITREFVAQIVSALREASFAEVASLHVSTTTRGPGRPPGARPVSGLDRAARGGSPTRVTASPAREKQPAGDASRQRQTADRRAELGERVVKALQDAEAPLGVRALSSELGIAPDLLAAPLRELRSAGRIAKHGEKRATTYSVA